ncbi:MAG: hypothetical protein E7668_04685 [Ruminococcaceae bacterium]|nr:hypothetical protein [Oscillospiraceae bacterium]
MFQKIISTTKDAKAMFDPWKGMYVKKIFNIGDFNFYEYPLFICSDQLVYCLFFGDRSISLQGYKTEEFEENIVNGLFQNPQDKSEFCYLHPNCEMIESSISDIQINSMISNERNKPMRINFVFDNQNSLCIRCSDVVPGAMDSWIEYSSIH